MYSVLLNKFSMINYHVMYDEFVCTIHTVHTSNYTVWWETFEVENFRGSVRSEHFAEKTFAEY